MRNLSPLRYPGGKVRLTPFFAQLLTIQEPVPTRYAEPFAGGAGAALRLLDEGYVSHIHINDIHPGIAAFWRSVTTQPEEFIARINSTAVTIEEWHAQHEVFENGSSNDDLSLGFATFFLNRTNRSGILTARPIGGLEQTGKWLIDARYNKQGLIGRIERIAQLAGRITVTELDALDFLDNIEHYEDDIFVYADPPYVVQGNKLYLHAFNADDHRALADKLLNALYPWILTYDDERIIWEDLYGAERCARFNIAHTAQNNHVGSETIIYGPTITVPGTQEITPGRRANWI
ncbi:DNA adenine methylase [Schaalia cardiffensis]|uniref:DNA adenine methylase n=1 Tax=Schaalia cardiffensis TaxID=181487 RepID=UPI002AB00B51|nr:DNA adenine methylase [Schaalia cardiffensis]